MRRLIIKVKRMPDTYRDWEEYTFNHVTNYDFVKHAIGYLMIDQIGGKRNYIPESQILKITDYDEEMPI